METKQSNLESSNQDEISLIEIATTLGEEKKILLGIPIVAAIIAVVVSLLLPPVYTAHTTLLPSKNNSNDASALLGNLSGLVGNIAGLGNATGTSDMFIHLLESRTAKNLIIQKFDLVNHFGQFENNEEIYDAIDKKVKISLSESSTLINIQVDDEDPAFAAQIANGYFEVLQTMLDKIAISEAQQKRAFFQQQFAKSKDNLSEAEIKLKEVQETTGLLELEGQAKATIDAVAQLRAGIAQREVQLTALRTFATNNNPEYQKLLGELSGLRTQLQKMETGSVDSESNQAPNNDIGFINTSNLPKQGLEYIRALREVKYQEAIFEIMAKQFELAKIEEAKEGNTIQQLDPAIVPERKSKPKRAMIVILSTLAAGFLAVIIALIRGAMRKHNTNSAQANRLIQLKQAWGFK